MDDRVSKFLRFAGWETTGAAAVSSPMVAVSETPGGIRPRQFPVLLTGWTTSTAAAARAFTEDTVTGVASVPEGTARFVWEQVPEPLRQELIGARLTVDGCAARLWTFDVTTDRRVETLVSLNGKPWFVRVHAAAGTTYLLGISELPDIDDPVLTEENGWVGLIQLLPALMFLRHHYATEVWQPPATAFGNFIIDDPLLIPTYGFMDHGMLATRVARGGAAATIAFIPWNARRSEPDVVELYKGGTGLAICVHGFEHTAGEFADEDAGRVTESAVAAIEGMRLHERLTGLRFDPVMVFPQGRFSRQGMIALSRAGFLAAVNTHYLAANDNGTVRLRDLLEPAIGSYGNCPLFIRRYPGDLDAIRSDLALGRPAFFVEHHEYFRDGGAAMSRLFEDVAAIRSDIQWARLSDAIERTHLVKRTSRLQQQVKFYGRRLVFEADHDARRTYLFTKGQRDGAQCDGVIINDTSVPFEAVAGELRFSAELNPGERIRIVVDERERDAPPPVGARPLTHRARVAARRYLSEFRDNRVDTSPVLRRCLATAKRVAGR